jgi:lysophospholipase L1-like esterase
MKHYKWTYCLFLSCLLTFSTATTHAAKKKIACVGNSITEGVALPFHRAQAYPSLLYDFFDKNEFEINNYGVSGFAVKHTSNAPYRNTAQYRNIQEWQPDIVTVKLGTNDTHSYNWNGHENEFEDDYRELVNSFKSLDSHPEIYLCLPVPIFPEGETQSNILLNDVLPLIRKVAGETGATIIDLHTPFRGKRSELFADDLHPNVKGARYLAYLIAQAISPDFDEDISYIDRTSFVLPVDLTDKYTEINSSDPGLDATPLIDNDASTVFSLTVEGNNYVEVKLQDKVKLAAYTITAGGSTEASVSWELQTFCRGKWTGIDSRQNITFQAGETQLFALSPPSFYDAYRLVIKGGPLNIGEWQLFGNSFSSNLQITSNRGTISDQYGINDHEGVQCLIDKKIDTKYCAVDKGATFRIEYLSPEPANITRYALTSANDAQERDPGSWTLEASNNGENWDTLDVQANQHFPIRFMTAEYPVENGKENTKYTHFRLNILNTVSGGRTFQLAEWQLFGNKVQAQTFPLEIEAENADFNHYMSIKDGSAYSGGKGLDGQDTKSSYVQYCINGIEEAGTYDVEVYYASAQNRHFYSKVNDQFPVVVATPDMGSRDDPEDWKIVYPVYFDAGNNVLEIGAYNAGSQYLANIDKLSITKSAEKIKRPPYIFELTREAEEYNTIDNLLKSEAYGFLSGGICIGGRNGRASYCISNIPEAGEYDMLIYYADMQQRSFYVKSNDDERIVLQVQETTQSWGDSHNDASLPVTYRLRTRIHLDEGENTLELGHETALSDWAPNLDKFEIVKIGTYEPDTDNPNRLQYPNTEHSLYVHSNKIVINAASENVKYTILNLLGAPLATGRCTTPQTSVYVPGGIYIVLLETPSGKQASKVIVY